MQSSDSLKITWVRFLIYTRFIFAIRFYCQAIIKENQTRTSTKSNQASRSQPETKKTKVIDLTEDNVDFDMEERRLSLKER